MKKLVVILGLISAITATILSVTKFFNLSILPIIIAFVCGLILIFLSKQEQTKIKPIQYIFLLVIASLSFTIYKGVIHTSELDDTIQMDVNEPLEQKDEKNLEAIIDNNGSDQKL